MTREREPADRIEIESCGDPSHLHIVLFDAEGRAFGDATLGKEQVLGFIEHLRKQLYAMSALGDE